jgi:hypothetical protein
MYGKLEKKRQEKVKCVGQRQQVRPFRLVSGARMGNGVTSFSFHLPYEKRCRLRRRSSLRRLNSEDLLYGKIVQRS